MSTVKQALSAAKDILLTDGWIVGDFRCEGGGYCASGAIRAATGGFSCNEEVSRPDDPDDFRLYAGATLALAEVISPNWYRDFADTWEADYDDGYVGEEEPDEESVLDQAEDIIFDFNDNRVKSLGGRDAVLAKFDEAIASQ